MKIKMKRWYCEYKGHTRIFDYVNIMICNFPLFTVRRYDFDLHTNQKTAYSFGIIGFTIMLYKPKLKLI